jgi:selenium metabolism protein YedF
MIETVDARGLACPEPVIKTRSAMEGGEDVLTIVDNETAQKNVTRMAEKSGGMVEPEVRADGIYLHIRQEAGAAESAEAEVTTPLPGVARVLVVPDEFMGRGEHNELGQVLMRSFFHTLGEVEPLPETIIFFNSGVKLVVEGSPVIEDLRALAAEGVEILACGTCLGYYELKDNVVVATVSNMYTIAETMLGADRLVYV